MAKTIFINRYFYPDHSATSQMLSDLAFALAGDGGEVSGGGGFHGGGEAEVFRGRVWESEVLTMGNEQAAGLRG